MAYPFTMFPGHPCVSVGSGTGFVGIVTVESIALWPRIGLIKPVSYAGPANQDKKNYTPDEVASAK
jgi:hypothetical protein